jgi:hypothetical protein
VSVPAFVPRHVDHDYLFAVCHLDRSGDAACLPNHRLAACFTRLLFVFRVAHLRWLHRQGFTDCPACPPLCAGRIGCPFPAKNICSHLGHFNVPAETTVTSFAGIEYWQLGQVAFKSRIRGVDMCGVMQESAERPYPIESKTGMASLSPLATQSRPRKSASCIQPAMVEGPIL